MSYKCHRIERSTTGLRPLRRVLHSAAKLLHVLHNTGSKLRKSKKVAGLVSLFIKTPGNEDLTAVGVTQGLIEWTDQKRLPWKSMDIMAVSCDSVGRVVFVWKRECIS